VLGVVLTTLFFLGGLSRAFLIGLSSRGEGSLFLALCVGFRFGGRACDRRNLHTNTQTAKKPSSVYVLQAVCFCFFFLFGLLSVLLIYVLVSPNRPMQLVGGFFVSDK
jgi:hypothetical protein